MNIILFTIGFFLLLLLAPLATYGQIQDFLQPSAVYRDTLQPQAQVDEEIVVKLMNFDWKSVVLNDATECVKDISQIYSSIPSSKWAKLCRILIIFHF